MTNLLLSRPSLQGVSNQRGEKTFCLQFKLLETYYRDRRKSDTSQSFQKEQSLEFLCLLIPDMQESINREPLSLHKLLEYTFSRRELLLELPSIYCQSLQGPQKRKAPFAMALLWLAIWLLWRKRSPETRSKNKSTWRNVDSKSQFEKQSLLSISMGSFPRIFIFLVLRDENWLWISSGLTEMTNGFL